MRALIFVLILAILAVIAAIVSGFLDISQVRGAKAPEVSTTSNGVVSKGGQAPAFDVQTGSVKVGTTETTVRVPALEVRRPGNASNATEGPAENRM